MFFQSLFDKISQFRFLLWRILIQFFNSSLDSVKYENFIIDELLNKHKG